MRLEVITLADQTKTSTSEMHVNFQIKYIQ